MVTLGMVWINITEPDEFEQVVNCTKLKASQYDLFKSWLGTGILASSGKHWQIRRKMLTPAFSFSILKEFVTIFNKETDELVKSIQEKKNAVVNTVSLASHLSLRIITGTAMACELDKNSQNDRDYIQAINFVVNSIFRRALRPWNQIPFLYYNFTREGRYEKKMLDVIFNFSTSIIKKREAYFQKHNVNFNQTSTDEKFTSHRKRKMSMLDVMLDAKMYQGIVDHQGVIDEVNTIIFGGYDTTAMALSFMLMLIASHEDVQKRLYEEIMQNLPENGKHRSLSELNNLNYMECVLKEGLRLYPSIPFVGRLSDEEIITKDGLVLPKNSNILLHIFDIHRNEKYWPEPNKFDPDRFLPENSLGRHPFAFVPFGVGSRNCLGQKFAMLEMKAVLCGILENFILKPVDTPDTVNLVFSIMMKAEHESIRVKFINRII